MFSCLEHLHPRRKSSPSLPPPTFIYLSSSPPPPSSTPSLLHSRANKPSNSSHLSALSLVNLLCTFASVITPFLQCRDQNCTVLHGCDPCFDKVGNLKLFKIEWGITTSLGGRRNCSSKTLTMLKGRTQIKHWTGYSPAWEGPRPEGLSAHFPPFLLPDLLSSHGSLHFAQDVN